jgi:hypothetical protein
MTSSAQAKKCRWRVNFSLTDKVLAKTIIDLPDIKLLTEVVRNNTYITAIEIATPESSFAEATEFSSLAANRCCDLISFIVGRGVSCTLQQMNEIGPPGTVKAGFKSFTTDAIIEAPKDFDLSTAPFLKVLDDKDQKLARQLSHYRRGIASLDIIEKVREFYLVLEDETGSQFKEKYQWLRDLVSHPELNRPTASKEKATERMGRTYVDPSSPRDMENLQEKLEQIKLDAEISLGRKLCLFSEEGIEKD